MFKIIKNTIWQGLGKMVMMGVGFVTTSLLIRGLGEEIYGMFCLISSSFILVDALAEMGTKMIGVREISKCENKQKTLSNIIFLRFVMVIAALGFGLGFAYIYPAFSKYRTEALLALTMSFWTYLAGNLEIRFQAEERMGKKSLVDSLFPSIFLVLFLVFFREINLLLVFGLYLVARVVSLVIGFGMVSDKDKFILKKVELNLVKKLFWQSMPIGVFLLMFTAYDKAIDSMIIERFLGVAEVGWYSLAYKIYGNLVMPAYFLVSSALPSFSREKGTETYKKTLKLAIFGSIVLLPIVFLIGPILIRIVGGEEFNYVASGRVFRILSVGLVFSFINHVQGFFLVSKDREKQMLLVGAVALIFNLTANLWVAPRFGVTGVAWVTAITEMIMSGMYLVISN